jgi:hypothetical protein
MARLSTSLPSGQQTSHGTAPAHREDALKDFAGYSNDVMGLLKLTDENLDVVSGFMRKLSQWPTDRYSVGNL